MTMPKSMYEPGNNLSSPIFGVPLPVAAVVIKYPDFPIPVFTSCGIEENTHVTMFAEIQFVIIQTMTSLTLKNARNNPGIAPQSAPKAIPTTTANNQMKNDSAPFLDGMLNATNSEPIAPI